jgi:hypothetical protein
MATIRSFTSLEQSKKLAEFLLVESADLYYYKYGLPHFIEGQGDYESIRTDKYHDYIPCWSLAALLEEIPDTTANMVGEGLKLHIDKDGFQYSLFYENEYTGNVFEIETELYDNMIDACYEMIIKLHEQKLL